MNDIEIKGTNTSPAIKFVPGQGKIEVKGRSFPEDAYKFYEPLMESLREYASNPNPVTIVDFRLEYFTTSSSKCIYKIFKILESINRRINQVTVNWYYEKDDEIMFEEGENFMDLTKLTFNLKEVEQN
ncbi:MAG: DUF1987 domain-containing protein [Bacteroidia bacterium]